MRVGANVLHIAQGEDILTCSHCRFDGLKTTATPHYERKVPPQSSDEHGHHECRQDSRPMSQDFRQDKISAQDQSQRQRKATSVCRLASRLKAARSRNGRRSLCCTAGAVSRMRLATESAKVSMNSHFSYATILTKRACVEGHGDQKRRR
jgi:hypothetical protein